MKKSWFLGLIALLLVAAACQSAAPLHQYVKGDVVATNDFSNSSNFEEGAYGAATLQVIDGTYQINVMQGDNVLWWGQWGDTYKDSVIDVDAEQLTETNENAYGIMCRVQGNVGQKQPVDASLEAMLHDSTAEPTSEASAMTAEVTAEATAVTSTAEATAASSAATAETALVFPQLTATASPTPLPVPNGNGYLFLIQGGGQFAIFRSTSRNLKPLVDWTTTDAIKQGAASNHLRAVCAGTYLAFYINDTFVGDATDDTYNSGQIGLAASSANRAGTRISFDNLTVANAVAK